MDIAMWMLVGGIFGWIGYAFLGFNQGRGNMASIIIGVMGGFVGGKAVAPMFLTAAGPGVFSVSALFFAAAIAAVFLLVGNLVHNRWGV